MSKFGHLKALQVSGDDTADFTFYEIEGAPVLECSPATSVNKPFFNEVLRRSKVAARKLKGRRNQIPTQGQLDEVRRQDVALFVEYIVKGWRNVVDQEGNAVEFNADECAQFLTAIPDDMFEELRNFCLDIANFRDAAEMEPAEKEELTGN
jgi:hypothetical protein